MRKLSEENEKVVVKGKLVNSSEISLPSIVPSSFKNRCHSRLIYDSLLFIKNSGTPSKTALMYGVGLSFTQLQNILKQLKKQRLVRVIEKNKKIYLVLTEKGLRAVTTGHEFLTSIGEL